MLNPLQGTQTYRKRVPQRRPGTIWLIAACAALSCLAACGPAAAGRPGTGQALGANPDGDPGTPLGGRPAPGFRLGDQFGQPVSLHQFRGKVVLLAFIDSTCTNVCPLITAAMTETKSLLATAGRQVRLLAVNANPHAAAVGDVRAYSRDHGMLNQWDFLTGSPAQLAAVWKAYGMAVQIRRGLIDHTPALFVIGPGGGEQRVYLTQLAYASISQSAQIIAREVARLLPGHPRLTHPGQDAYIRGLPPTTRTSLQTLLPAGRTRLSLGPGRPRLIVFFTTWLRETSGLRQHLRTLNAYTRTARARGLPPLAAIDEATTEPSLGAVRRYLNSLGFTLAYPVAADTTGRVADGYGVQDQPWFVLITASGKIVWHHDGWLPPAPWPQPPAAADSVRGDGRVGASGPARQLPWLRRATPRPARLPGSWRRGKRNVVLGTVFRERLHPRRPPYACSSRASAQQSRQLTRQQCPGTDP